MGISNSEIRVITNLLKEIQYGAISIAINDGKNIEVESLTRKRFNSKNITSRFVR